MSQAAYERKQARLELYAKLNEAAIESAQGDAVVEHPKMMRRLKSSSH